MSLFSSTHCRHGRLGNQILRWMSLIGLAKRFNTTYTLPVWKYAEYFQNPIPMQDGVRCLMQIKEPHYHYEHEFWEQYREKFETKTMDLHGWFQSPKYWIGAEAEIKEALTFKPEFLAGLKEKYKEAFLKPTIALSIRKGDFWLNPNYYQLPITYYLGALFTHFPNWKECNLLLFSDDIGYCKLHFGCLDNAYFMQGTDIEQLALLTLADSYIISNSTFSYCGAYLTQNQGAKVIRPKKNMDGPLLKTHDEKDFWPQDRWTIFEHENYKIDLKDVTFTIPVSYDHPDRKQNLDLSVCLLQRDFDTHVIVMEQGGEKFSYMKQYCRYERLEGKDFHRTKMLNQMAELSETDLIVNFDCDTVLPVMQILQSVEKLREGADMVYPFDGRSARVPRNWFGRVEKYLDAGIFGVTQFKGMDAYNSVGHCIFFRKDSFIEGGMENEYFISFGPEDVERYERFTRLGFKVERVKGPVYHMDHFIGVNSGNRNPYFKKNWAELEKIRQMTDRQLQDYVKDFSWTHPYTPEYYKSIVEGSIRSRDEVFQVLPKLMQIPKSVVDVGTGQGQWLYEIEKFGVNRYLGVDHKVNKRQLLIPQENYQDVDLTKVYAYYSLESFDLTMCLEVAEHLPEENAEGLVKLLCGLSDYVLFSAAIKGQGGVGHQNEQWQTWWERLFNQNGYYASEQPIKDLLKGNPNVEVWYRQNLVLYSKHFRGKAEDYIDPQMWLNIISQLKQTA
jgi:SAM-dependent methyltransferase